jgi:large subunit ribosomal protein L3
MLGLYARKLGMTQFFTAEGNLVAATALRIEPNLVVAARSEEKNGYSAVVLGLDDYKKDKKGEYKISKPLKGQFSEGWEPKRRLHEVRDFEAECSVGDTLGIEVFQDCNYVDVCGVSKGKGFQGVVKRFGFGGGRKTHGSKFHREPGSTGQSTYPHKTFKNMKLPGRMGREQVTTLNIRIVKIDAERKLLLVKGAVPGVDNGLIFVRKAVKK